MLRRSAVQIPQSSVAASDNKCDKLFIIRNGSTGRWGSFFIRYISSGDEIIISKMTHASTDAQDMEEKTMNRYDEMEQRSNNRFDATEKNNKF